MEKNKQIQESGDNSQQFMANTLIVNNNGLTEQQVRAIINGEIANTLKENQLVANDIALKRLNEFEEFTSYSQIWIKKDSEEFYKLCQEFKDNNLPMNIIIDNPLDTNFKTLKTLKKEQINNLSITKVISEPKQSVNIQIPITEKQKNVITSIFDNNKFKNNGNNNEKILFEQKLNEYKNLKYINEWWNKYITKFSIRLNSIGKVIAHTNIKNIDPSLPDLD